MRVSTALRAAALTALLGAPLMAQEGRDEDVKGREEWFWAQRSFPSTERPYAQMAAMRTQLFSILASMASKSITPPLGGSWRSIGPNGFWDAGAGFFGSGGQLDAGRISAISPARTANGPMYIATASGGVWRSSDNGNTWQALTDNQCGLSTGALAVDPVTPSRVYVGTGEGNSGQLGCGALISADGGNVWSNATSGLSVGGGGFISFFTMLVDAATAGSATNTVLLGGINFSNAGIARSTNSGTTWSVQATGMGVVTSLVAHATQAGTYYAGSRLNSAGNAQRGVYKSTNSGATWTQLPALPVANTANIGRIELAVSASAPNLIWAIVANASTSALLGLFRFDENTQQWTQLAASGVVTANTNRGDFGAQGFYDLVINVDPRDPNKIFLAGVRAYKSVNGGASFTPMAMEIHCDWHVITFDRFNPDIMWAGTDGGVFRSTDAGATWVAKNAGLAITQYYPGISIHPQATRIMGGSQDNGTHLYSGSLFWDGFHSGDGGYTAINHQDPNVMWAESQWSTSGAGLVRKDLTSFVSRNTGIVASDRGAFIPPFVMDPVSASTLYFGTQFLYKTTNDGALWAKTSALDLTGGSGSISTISVSPADPLTIWVGTSDGRAQVSRDGGATWLAATGMPGKAVTAVRAHPTNPLRALITVSGFGTGHVFETQDAFATPVTNISGNLINAPTNVAIYIASQGVIVAGTDVGVFQTADNGVSWTVGPGGMPNAIVNDLVFQQSTGLLIAATFGRGMWAFDVGTQTAVLRGDVNADGVVNAADALIVQQALTANAPMSTVVFPRGDANCNSRIDAADLVIILRAAVGLPNGAACVGTLR